MNIAGIPVPVFALSIIDRYMDGYFVDRDLNVWSTKGRTPARLSGTQTPSGRYFTLNKRTHRALDLQRKVRLHPNFLNETSSQVVATVNARTVVAQGGLPVSLPPGRTKSPRQAAASKGYMLATINPNDKLVIGTEPVFHLDEATAKTEAERVASLNGSEVLVLKIVGKVKVQKAVWE